MPELSPEAKEEIKSAAAVIRNDYGPGMIGKVLESYGLKKPEPGPDDPPNNPDDPAPPPPKDPPPPTKKRGLWWTPGEDNEGGSG